MSAPPTFWARLKAQLTGAPTPEPVVELSETPLRAVVRGPELTVGPGIDWDTWERTRVLRRCACRLPHRRCDECAQYVCTMKRHDCPAAYAEMGGGR